MNILHTVSQSPKSRLLESCLNIVSDGDAILFIEDGVYYCKREDLLEQITNTVKCFGLKEDLIARGLQIKGESTVENASYRKFVELCVNYDKVISWF